ncbi:MAG: HNH endonuclease [Bacteroidaceae bacterium]|nr:HNH endonuclease [Bacteroidaceae bacterium]
MQRTKQEVEEAVRNSKSIADVCRFLGIKPIGGNYRIIHKAIDEFNIDTSHFTGQGWNVGLKFRPSKPKDLKDILVKGSYFQSFKLKRRLLSEGLKEKKCESCNLTTWMGLEIPLELHHVNGDNSDNRIENLKLLCPNCHALTDSYRGLNKSAHRETGEVELP